MRIAAGILIPITGMLLACGPTTELPPFSPTADVKLLMQAVVDPQADVVWDSVKWIKTEAGTEEIRPRTDDEWNAVRNGAITLAESGNLLMIAPRARDDADWTKSALAMIEASRLAMKAAEAKDVQQLFDMGGQIYSACTQCHQKFIVEPATPPAPAQ